MPAIKMAATGLPMLEDWRPQHATCDADIHWTAHIASLHRRFNANELHSIDQQITGFMRRYDVPGMSIAMTKGGRLVYAKGFGIARRLTFWERLGLALPRPRLVFDEAAGGRIRILGIDFQVPRNPPVTPWHLFRIASVTKPITSVTIMKLMEQGKVNLTDRVFGTGGLLGNKFGFATLDALIPPSGSALDTNIKRLKKITVQHLLEHTCGGWNNNYPTDPMFLHPTMNHADLITWVLQNRPLTNEPGTVWQYSNFGYCLLGRVIEQVTGKTYADHVKADVLAPCGIHNMHIAGNTRSERRSDEVEYFGQSFRPPPNQPIYSQFRLFDDPYGCPVARTDSHGGWIASPVDLVRFAVHVDGFRRRPDNDSPIYFLTDDIVGGDAVKVMTTPSTVMPNPQNYAKGWAINPDYWIHMGALPGSQAILIRTNNGICLAAATNTWRRSWATPNINTDFQAAMVNVFQTVALWPDHDLFPLYDDPWSALPAVPFAPVPFGTEP